MYVAFHIEAIYPFNPAIFFAFQSLGLCAAAQCKRCLPETIQIHPDRREGNTHQEN